MLEINGTGTHGGKNNKLKKYSKVNLATVVDLALYLDTPSHRTPEFVSLAAGCSSSSYYSRGPRNVTGSADMTCSLYLFQ